MPKQHHLIKRCPECNGIIGQDQAEFDQYCTARVKYCRTETCSHRHPNDGGNGFAKGHEDVPCSECGQPTCSECGRSRKCERYKNDYYQVCQVHGGGSPKARGTGGGQQGFPGQKGPRRKYDKWLRDNSDLADAYEALQNDEILDGYEQEAVLLDALIADAIRTLNEQGPLLETWRAAQDTLKAFDRAVAKNDGAMADFHLNDLRRLLASGASAADSRREIREMIESKSRLVGKNRDYRLKKGYAITVEGQMALMQETVMALMEFVAEERQKAMIEAVRQIVARQKRGGNLPDDESVIFDIEPAALSDGGK